MEVKIQIPDNCELIKDGDTYIVKEKKSDEKPRTWEEFCKNNPITSREYFIDEDSYIYQCNPCTRKVEEDRNSYTSEEEAEAFLALMQLRQLRKAWVGDWEQSDDDVTIGYITYSIKKKQVVVDYGWIWHNSALSFPTEEMAQEFLSCFKDLCEKAKFLL